MRMRFLAKILHRTRLATRTDDGAPPGAREPRFDLAHGASRQREARVLRVLVSQNMRGGGP